MSDQSDEPEVEPELDQEITDEDGRKVTDDGGVTWQLVEPSDTWLADHQLVDVVEADPPDALAILSDVGSQLASLPSTWAAARPKLLAIASSIADAIGGE